MTSIRNNHDLAIATFPDFLALQEMSWALLEISGKKILTDKDKRLFNEWRSLVSQHISFSEVSLLEHATFLILERSAFADRLGDDTASAWIRAGIPISWDSLGAKSPSQDHLMAYETALNWLDRRELLLSPIGGNRSTLKTLSKRFVTSSFWNRGTFLSLTAMGAALFLPISREIVLSAVIGMIGASINEYTVHLGVGHASPEFTRSFRRLGFIGFFAEEINLAHRVHHSKMMNDFRVEFSSPETLRRVDNYVENEARKLVESRVVAGITTADKAEGEISRIISEIKVGGYGVDGTLAGCLAMNFLAFPFFMLNLILSLKLFLPMSGALSAILFFVASSFFLSGFIMQSLFSHRYLHMTDQDIEASIATGSTTAFMRWFMTTPVAKLQTRRHYRHHQEKFDYHGTANGVIMSFSFADFVFRGGVKEAEANHLARMRKEGFLPSGTSSKR